jgi:hypothetical protein
VIFIVKFDLYDFVVISQVVAVPEVVNRPYRRCNSNSCGAQYGKRHKRDDQHSYKFSVHTISSPSSCDGGIRFAIAY